MYKNLLLFGFMLLAGLSLVTAVDPPEPKPDAVPPSLETPFDQVMSVVMHQRCMNCHPQDDYPRQGADSHLHRFGIERGADGHGLPALQCATCHQTENNDFSGVPGAPHWHLAPLSMGWQGMSRTEVATAMLDRSKNGNRSHEQILEHLTKDKLVLWVFEPGVNHEGVAREKPPISQEAWVEAVTQWIENGAVIPEE
ncbi:MAG: hypothetical protein AAFR61_31660 [Bacteroidota bacterium]